MGKPKAPDGPDYKDLARLQEENNAFIGDIIGDLRADATQRQDVLDERTNDYYENITKPGALLNLENAELAQDQYQNKHLPARAEYTQALKDMNTDEYVDTAVAANRSDIMTASEAAYDGMKRELAGYGIPLGSALGTDSLRKQKLASTLAAAGSGNQTRQAERDKQPARLGAIVDATAGSINNTSNATTAGGNVGGQGVGATLNANAQAGQQYRDAANMTGMQSDMANNTFRSGIQDFQAREASNQWRTENGPFSTLAGLGGMALGGGLFGSDGGLVTADMSPSKGAIPEDVVLNVSPGEYVLNAKVLEAVGRKGVKDFEEKALKLLAETEGEAIPTGASA